MFPVLENAVRLRLKNDLPYIMPGSKLSPSPLHTVQPSALYHQSVSDQKNRISFLGLGGLGGYLGLALQGAEGCDHVRPCTSMERRQKYFESYAFTITLPRVY
jgi:hypothetical protein